MKRNILVLILSVFSVLVYAQEKPLVAIYMTSNDPINEIVANNIMERFISSGKYRAVERSASFLAALKTEQSYQHTGEVDDEQISALGQQFGAQFICVVSIFDVWRTEKYITVRIIDATSAEVIVSCSAHGPIADSQALMTTLDDLSSKLCIALGKEKKPSIQKVAVYIAKTNNRDVDLILGDQLVAGLARSGDYMVVERTNAFLNKIKEETGYQQSGEVDDEDFIRLGQQFGVQYVCVAKTNQYGGTYFISAHMIDVTKAEVKKPYNIKNRVLNNSNDVINAAQEIVENISRIATYNRENYVENIRGINMKMIWVEGGDFYMGSIDDDSYYDEKDVRNVILDGFYMGMLEVTQDQWKKIMGKGEGGDSPVTDISWDEAMEFCRILSSKTGKNYKLPTEAQWEYAARGGKNGYHSKYAGSDKIKEVAWYEKSVYNYTSNGGYYSKYLHIGGQLKANEIGLYDMSGNAYEWCMDWYAKDYLIYDTYNPQGPATGTERVLRGGCYDSYEKSCRVSARYKSNPSSTWRAIGFRVVCIP